MSQDKKGRQEGGESKLAFRDTLIEHPPRSRFGALGLDLQRLGITSSCSSSAHHANYTGSPSPRQKRPPYVRDKASVGMESEDKWCIRWLRCWATLCFSSAGACV